MRAAAVYAIGAALYYAAIDGLGVTFDATPLLIGAVMLAASVFRRRLLASAVLLLAWGAAVLLVRHGPLPDHREAPVFLIAFGLAMAALVLLRRWLDPRIALESAAIVLLAGGLAFYGAFASDVFTSAWLWSAALLASAIILAADAFRRT